MNPHAQNKNHVWGDDSPLPYLEVQALMISATAVPDLDTVSNPTGIADRLGFSALARFSETVRR
jgi:hypothetical protein